MEELKRTQVRMVLLSGRMTVKYVWILDLVRLRFVRRNGSRPRQTTRHHLQIVQLHNLLPRQARSPTKSKSPLISPTYLNRIPLLRRRAKKL